jgi:hypothetical protein
MTSRNCWRGSCVLFLDAYKDPLANIRSLLYAAPVLMTVDTRIHPQAAKAASALPCWYALVETSQFGDTLALAERRMS